PFGEPRDAWGKHRQNWSPRLFQEAGSGRIRDRPRIEHGSLDCKSNKLSRYRQILRLRFPAARASCKRDRFQMEEAMKRAFRVEPDPVAWSQTQYDMSFLSDGGLPCQEGSPHHTELWRPDRSTGASSPHGPGSWLPPPSACGKREK